MRSKIFTKFSKAVDSHIGLSFSQSGGSHCDVSCRAFGMCYAESMERIYSSLDAKLNRHSTMGAFVLLNRAIDEIGKRTAPLAWARLSVNGSLPFRSSFTAKQWNKFTKRLRLFVQLCQDLGALWHIPVETLGKARSYRAALAGLGVIVRRTSQARTVDALMKSSDHRSWIVGNIRGGAITKRETADNVETANEVARTIRKAGQTAVVCPAVARDSKCGKCTACADARVDVVLYPFHA